MKEELIFKKSNGGFSTLEMLIAMTILVMVISTVMLVSFGNQSMLIDSQTNAEALSIAQGILEKEQALARKDFKLVNSIATTTDEIYQIKVDVVSTSSDPSLVFFTKKITATVSWAGENNRNLSVSLSTLVTNFENAVGGDTCDSILSPNADAWKNPQIKNSIFDFAQLAGVSGIYPITDLDAYKGKLYVTTNNISVNQNTFFIFNITDPAYPVLDHGGVDKIDNDSVNKSGLNAVAVAENASGNGKIYAYVANATSTGQLQIIDVSVSPPQVLVTYQVPDVTGSQGVGNSIFYKDGFVYLGLKATGGNGPEFNIIDVHDFLAHPTDPVGHPPVRAGSYSVGNDINSIYVKGNYAYLATSNSQELIVLDDSDPNDISTGSPIPWGYDAAGAGNGKSLYLMGDTLYLGRTVGGTEFYILNNSDPTHIPTNNPDPPSPYPYTQSIGSSVDGLFVRTGLDTTASPILHNLAFLLTPSNFQVWDITNLSAINRWSPAFLSLPASGSSIFEPVLDCEGNNFFVGSNDSTDRGYLSVIAP